jgi:polyhydroxyalkanoate synthesis repressor PhaR
MYNCAVQHQDAMKSVLYVISNGELFMSESLRLIKKYPNRRLYDTKTSAYITLSDVKGLVLSQERFMVVDAKTGEDLTRGILLQIIFEEETVGVPLFTAEFLVQLIRFYGHAMQGMVGPYLETNIKSFSGFQVSGFTLDELKNSTSTDK